MRLLYLLLQRFGSCTDAFFQRAYDEYTSELSSGHLLWSPVHSSEAFWSENALKLNEKDYQQLKLVYLLDLLLVLTMRCNSLQSAGKAFERIE